MGFTVDIKADLSGLRKLEKASKSINKKHIKFGWIDGKNYPSSGTNGGISIAQVAYWQNFGKQRTATTPPIPARPYFSQSINMAKQNYMSNFKTIYANVLFGTDVNTSLNKLAGELVKDYSESVLRQNYTPLAPKTVQIKGHSYQMDDTGLMITNFKAKVYRVSLNSSRG